MVYILQTLVVDLRGLLVAQFGLLSATLQTQLHALWLTACKQASALSHLHDVAAFIKTSERIAGS